MGETGLPIDRRPRLAYIRANRGDNPRNASSTIRLIDRNGCSAGTRSSAVR